MKNYLSFSGGVNSVAMYLLFINKRVDFEPIFVNHGTDWPDTYRYIAFFQWWCKRNGYPNIKVLTPKINTIEGVKFSNLYEYYKFKRVFPCAGQRSCSDKFKRRTVLKYIDTPCFMNIGFDYGEINRVKISNANGVENRFPLIEYEIDRNACKNIILSHDLPIPMKSGCFICPYQKIDQYKDLRVKYPDLFCKVEQLENGYIERRMQEGKKPIFIKNKAPIRKIINENQKKIFEQDEYPPCQCVL